MTTAGSRRGTEPMPQPRDHRRELHPKETLGPPARSTTIRTPLGWRWTAERTNSWLTNYGQLRRNTDRQPHHPQAQLALAITLIITIKLIDWRNR